MTKAVSEKLREKIRNMKKEDYIVLLLIGVLLVIISLPSEKDTAEKSGFGIPQQEGDAGNGETAAQGGKTDAESQNTASEAQKAAQEAQQAASEIQSAGGVSNHSVCYDIDSYVENMEKRVETILSGMEGAGKVRVMIMVADCGKEIVEKDAAGSVDHLEEADDTGGVRKSAQESQSEETVYIRDAEGNEAPFVAQVALPEVTGVVVAAQGAENRSVKDNIIEAVEVLFNLSEHRIKVIKMKS